MQFVFSETWKLVTFPFGNCCHLGVIIVIIIMIIIIIIIFIVFLRDRRLLLPEGAKVCSLYKSLCLNVVFCFCDHL